MTRLVYGERIAKDRPILLACSTVVFDDERRVLLTRRADNGRWCLPGGHFESGESVAEAAVRETKEETGFDVSIVRLVGVYSDPDRVLEYADGNQYHLVALSFEARIIGGELTESEETTEFLWCAASDVEGLDLMEHHGERIADALRDDTTAWVR